MIKIHVSLIPTLPFTDSLIREIIDYIDNNCELTF